MVESKNYAIQVLRKQLKGNSYSSSQRVITTELSQNEEIGCSVGLEDESNFFKWNVVFEGPTDTLYEVSSFFHLMAFNH